MTKEELVKKMGGREDRAEWVMEELLRSVKPEFIKLMLRSKATEMDNEITKKEANGYYMDDWRAPDGFNFFSYEISIATGNDKDGSKAKTIDQYNLWEQRQYEKASDKQSSNFYHNMHACFCSH